MQNVKIVDKFRHFTMANRSEIGAATLYLKDMVGNIQE